MKEKAVRLLIEVEDDYPSRWVIIEVVAPKIGCGSETEMPPLGGIWE
ncbi:hypothetical protein [Suttonella ornithocola]|uniref:Uncharacterized protein n=1 Tax=Suttonella ornithocola TaxID=279832 RepID=A0A380MLD0_9GAMM|nr:hypothetical protein [Suttonella ornithocola]SUO93449.1 Uncharacterised protein [Suttonella ornithocola]